MSDLEKKETAYSKTIQEADTIMARLMMMMMIMTPYYGHVGDDDDDDDNTIMARW